MGKRTYFPQPITPCQKMKNKFLSMFKGCERATRTFLKCEKHSINARFEANWVEVSWLSHLDAIVATGSYARDLTKKC